MSFRLSRLAQQVVALIQSAARKNAQREGLLGTVGQRLEVQPRASPPVDLEYSAVYPQFFRATLEFALRPHAARRHHLDASSCTFKSAGWQWLAHQVRECLQEPTRKHAERGSLLLSATLRPLGDRGASELWRIICTRRMGRDTWEFIPPRDP